jgi:hypothetical protein
VLATGTPEAVAACETSHTGRFLADLLRRDPCARGDRPARGLR